MLDERTILVMTALMQVLLAVLAVAVRRGHAEFAAGMGSWAWGVLLMSFGSMSTMLGDGSQVPLRLAISNACYVPGISLIGFGMVRFLGQSPAARHWVVGTLLVYGVGVMLSMHPEQTRYRIAVFTTQQVTVAVLALTALVRSGALRGGVGGGVILAAMALLALAGVGRGVLAVTGWSQVRLLAGAPIVWVFMGTMGLVMLLGTIGMILAAGERMRCRLEQLASHDSLTGLLTRGGFSELACHVLAASRRETRRVGFLIIDIDHFKTINDQHGHQVGDGVLAAVAQRLNECAREIDLVSRFGGEEFAVLLPQADLAQARQAGERLRQRVAETPVEHRGLTVSVSVSIGVSCGDAADIALERLYREADAALYQAKAKGRNRVECAGESASAA